MKQRSDMNLNIKQSGFTIVEIMISMLLGLIMMVGVVSLMVGNKRSFQEQNETSRIQENARFAIQMLIEDVRMTGYVGCQANQDNDAAVTNLLAGVDDSYLLGINDPIEGIDNATGVIATTAPWAPSNFTSSSYDDNGSAANNVIGNMVAGTDAITVRYFVPTGVTNTASAAGTPITVSSVAPFSQNMIAVIADCTHANIFKIANDPTGGSTLVLDTNGTPANSGTTLTTPAYDTGSDVMQFSAVRYFIGADTNGDGNPNTGAQIAAADPTTYTPSLYRYVFINGAYTIQELISGVENMQILYGDEVNGFRSANNIPVADWDDVTSVKIALLLRSEAEVGTDTDTSNYNLLANVINPDDLRVRRRVFNATVQIRNRTD